MAKPVVQAPSERAVRRVESERLVDQGPYATLPMAKAGAEYGSIIPWVRRLIGIPR